MTSNDSTTTIEWPRDRVDVPSFLADVKAHYDEHEKAFDNADMFFNADVFLYDAIEAAHIALTTNTDDAINEFLVTYMHLGQS